MCPAWSVSYLLGVPGTLVSGQKLWLLLASVAVIIILVIFTATITTITLYVDVVVVGFLPLLLFIITVKWLAYVALSQCALWQLQTASHSAQHYCRQALSTTSGGVTNIPDATFAQADNLAARTAFTAKGLGCGSGAKSGTRQSGSHAASHDQRPSPWV